MKLRRDMSQAVSGYISRWFITEINQEFKNSSKHTERIKQVRISIDPRTDKSNRGGEKALAIVSTEKRKGIGMERRVHTYHA